MFVMVLCTICHQRTIGPSFLDNVNGLGDSDRKGLIMSSFPGFGTTMKSWIFDTKTLHLALLFLRASTSVKASGIIRRVVQP